jgi:hypothetical protein
LDRNWAHFVNQQTYRRKLLELLCGTAASPRGILLLGDSEVGKSWLLKWSSYAAVLSQVAIHYVGPKEGEDWLDLIRRLRDGEPNNPASPGFDPEVRNELNWKIKEFAEGRVPGPYVPGTAIDDTAGSHAEIMGRRTAINAFNSLVCEALIHALRQGTAAAGRVVILDNPSFATTATLKKPLLDKLAQAAPAESSRIVLCCNTALWQSYQQQNLDFSKWEKVEMGKIEPHHLVGLSRELLRLLFPTGKINQTHLFDSVEKKLIQIRYTRPLLAGKLYNFCQVFGEAEGLGS